MRSDSIFHTYLSTGSKLVSCCYQNVCSGYEKLSIFWSLHGVCICCSLVPILGLLIYAYLLIFIYAENRENSFSRSRSSSVSSIDRDSKEAITALYFMESFARKNDSAVSSCLWVGTGLGMVLILSLNLPASDDLRQSEPVMVSPSGKSAALFLFIICLGTTGRITAWFCMFFEAEVSQCMYQTMVTHYTEVKKDARVTLVVLVGKTTLCCGQSYMFLVRVGKSAEFLHIVTLQSCVQLWFSPIWDAVNSLSVLLLENCREAEGSSGKETKMLAGWGARRDPWLIEWQMV